MRAEMQTLADEIKQSVELLRRRLDWDKSKKELDELNAKAEDPNLWDNPEEAQSLMQKRTALETQMNAVGEIQSELDDLTELAELAADEGDDASLDESQELMAALHKRAAQAEIEALLSGEADANDCFVEIHPGAGGTESNDWAAMLLRMYVRWAKTRGFKVNVIEEQPGEEAGIKSATIEVKGHNAYGWLKTESGVHRLVRISPFDSNARRHTSFASVWVYPVVDDNINIEINESECRVDTFRASGAGGQHVNTTDSAVRITHEPTGIVVQCQNERSQHKNRATCWNMLKARLYEMELQKREEAAQAQAESKTDIGWGHQIRSYVLQPYQMVKDLRTQVEKPDPDAVLGGALDDFMNAALAQRVGGDG
ncbi:peptide chain release factor 2 [Hyphococcus flavus]|uniref:Peptide chain release factor 2 n=1 Tax=Hyphococcus flavus TaxID=1866326 RepID=A0AAE9ZE56_9PROT|nr:peptide chain release factor 2 [Hyphococcus flavus]WDI30872.1 peptide chain release factor 2 [Hyphococcus flavus]